MKIRRHTAGIAGIFLLVAALGLAWIWSPLGGAPRSDDSARLEAAFPPSREFVDRSGEPLALLLAENRTYRQPVRLGEVSPHFLNAIVAVEDARFLRHGGVDYLALARAGLQALRRGEIISGGSTITQQLAKLRLAGDVGPGARTLGGKWREMRLAWWLEEHFTKEEILCEYINRLEFGHQQQGIRAASWFFFGKPPAQLGIAESALLAGLPNAPSRLSPHRHPLRARERQLHVLDRMLANGSITKEEHERAGSEPLRLRQPAALRQAPAFVDLLLRRRGVVGLHGVLDGRLSTTLDAELTRFVTRVLDEQLSVLRDKKVGQGAVVVLDNESSEVLVLATAGRSGDGGRSTINGAWEPRSAGSALKPFAYLLAFEQGDYPGTVIADVPSTFPTPTGVYRPNNYNGRFYGPVSMRHALGNSLNLAAIHTLERIGGAGALHRFLRELGFSTLDNLPEHYGLGLVLGNAETRLLELANAYATVARMGVYRPLRFLRSDPTTEAASGGGGKVLFSPESAWLLADVLADNSARAASFGVDSALRFPFPVAVKTGTSSNYRDNVVVGFTPEFTVAVWVGNGDGSPMRGITGVTGAAPVLQEVFQHLHKRHGTTWFVRPAGVREFMVHALTGKQINPARLSARQRAELRREFSAVEPPYSGEEEFDELDRVILGADYAQWWQEGRVLLGARAALHPAAGSARVIYPPPGTKILLDPALPVAFQRLQVRAVGAGEFEWSSPSLPPPQDGQFFELREGRHELRARNSLSGEVLQTWVLVEQM